MTKVGLRWRWGLVATAAMVGLAGCGGPRAQTVASSAASTSSTAGSDSACAPAPGHTTTYDSNADWQAPKANAEHLSVGSGAPKNIGRSDDVLRLFSAIAIVRVVSRAPAQVKVNIEDGVDPSWKVVRPARIETVKVFKGSLDTCNDVERLGGVTPERDRAMIGDVPPRRMDPGDRLLALFRETTSGRQILADLVPIDSQGVARLPEPYGRDLPLTGPPGATGTDGPEERRRDVDVDTWTLSDDAKRPPEERIPEPKPTSSTAPSTTSTSA